MSMLTEICEEINNYFTYDDNKHIGTYSIVNGQLTPSVDILNNQYYAIFNSRFNDGVHLFGDETDVLTDEPEFNGSVWVTNIASKADFLALAAEIEEWQEKNGAADSANMSPLASESFGIYSYSKGSSGSSASGAGSTAVSWQEQYKGRLNKYRRMRGI